MQISETIPNPLVTIPRNQIVLFTSSGLCKCSGELASEWGANMIQLFLDWAIFGDFTKKNNYISKKCMVLDNIMQYSVYQIPTV